MTYIEAIRDKRDGKVMPKDVIETLVKGIASGDLDDCQVAAFAMATYINGMDDRETANLTMAMARSGKVIKWDEDDLGGPVVDKHSTGGVGDKVSLLLAPIVAACGGFVPMISGRGLGHTGGTLDKLEAIPGYRSEQPLEVFRKTVKEAGCAIVGASSALAPADRRLYAIRDVTETVASVPLITASILSKKRAAGVRRLVMDIKVGRGAFMQSVDDAMALSKSIVRAAKRARMKVVALLTDMSEPLGDTVGCALEVAEVIEILTGRIDGEPRLVEVTLELAAEMLLMAGLVDSLAAGKAAARKSIESGAAADRLLRMIELLGGDPRCMDDPSASLPTAEVQLMVTSDSFGYAGDVDPFALARAVVELGGGRKRQGGKVDHAVGLSAIAKRCEPVGRSGDEEHSPLAVVHARNERQAQAAARKVRQAIMRCQGPERLRSPVIERIG